MVLRTERGQNFAEFALAAMAFFMIIFGVLDFGRAIVEYNIIANSAREGARMAIIQTNTNAAILQRVEVSSVNLLSAGGGTCTSLPCTAGDITISGTRSCSPSCGTVTIAVTRTFTPVMPLISTIIGPSLTLRAASTMVVER